MTKANFFAVAGLCLLLSLATTASAREISLAWNANSEQDVAGYKIYYQANSRTLPFEGVDAIEGASPIDVGDATNFSLSGLADNRVYYFAVVAYSTNGVESGWSDIIASNWVPALVAPDTGAQVDSSLVRFIWESPPPGYDATYTLYYGTDPNLAMQSGPAADDSPLGRPLPPLAVLLSVAIGLLAYSLGTPRRRFATGALAMMLAFGVTACGGAGDGTGSSGSGGMALPENTLTVSIYMDKADYYEAYNLEPGKTYYWKVVATDSSDPQMPLESITRKFTSN